jgi:hypothetical protein
MDIKSAIIRWYRGGPLPTITENSPTSTTYRAPNTFEPSITARLAQWVVKNILTIIAIIITLVGLPFVASMLDLM